MFSTEYGTKLSSHCWFLASVLEEFEEFFPIVSLKFAVLFTFLCQQKESFGGI